MSIWRWVLVGGVVFGAMLAASLLATPRGWEQASLWASQWEEQWQRQQRPCPVLVGAAEPGEIREEMAVAARLAKGVDRAGRLSDYAMNLTLLDGELAEADRSLFRAMQPAVDALRKAARLHGTPRIGSAERPELLEVIDLLDACHALVEAAYLQRATDPNAACDQLLDGVRVAAELMHGVTLVETAVGAQLLGQCLVILGDTMLPVLPSARLLLLEKALREVDDSLPEDPAMAQCFACEVVSVARDPGRSGRAMPTASLRAWRYGFSEHSRLRALAISVVETLRAPTARAPGAAVQWSERRRELEHATEAVAAVGDPYLEAGSWDFVQLEQGVRAAVVQLRLLRLAVAFRNGSELPSLRDPLGDGCLSVKIDGNTAAFSSAQASLPARTAQRR